MFKFIQEFREELERIASSLSIIQSELGDLRRITEPCAYLFRDEAARRNRKKIVLAVSYRNGMLDHKWYSYPELSKWLGDRYQEPLVCLSNASPGKVIYIDGMLVTWVETGSIQSESPRYQLT